MKKYIAYNDKGEEILTTESALEMANKLNTTSAKIYNNMNKGTYFETKKFSDVYIKVIKQVIEEPEPISKIESLPGETWVEVPGYHGLYVSDMGRAKTVDSRGSEKLKCIVTSTNKNKREYGHINIGNKQYVFSRVIWRAFKDPDFPLEYHGGRFYKKHPEYNKDTDPYYNIVVDHIVENTKNLSNFLNNLQAVSQKKNINKAMENGIIVGKTPVKCYCRKGNEYHEFKSTKELVVFCVSDTPNVKPNNGYFNSAINKNHIIHGWKVGIIKE